jgi:hypothetical protein
MAYNFNYIKSTVTFYLSSVIYNLTVVTYASSNNSNAWDSKKNYIIIIKDTYKAFLDHYFICNTEEFDKNIFYMKSNVDVDITNNSDHHPVTIELEWKNKNLIENNQQINNKLSESPNSIISF